MPKDVDIAQALATALDAASTLNVYFDIGVSLIDQGEEPEGIDVWITLGNLDRQRLSRGTNLQYDAVLGMVILGKQDPSIGKEYIETWLEKWDEIQDLALTTQIEGCKSISITSEERFDREALHSMQRFRAEAAINYIFFSE